MSGNCKAYGKTCETLKNTNVAGFGGMPAISALGSLTGGLGVRGQSGLQRPCFKTKRYKAKFF